MNNIILMKKVSDLMTQPLRSREQSLRVMTQVSVIRRAFGIKDGEHEKPIIDYDRQRIMTDSDIKNKFNGYIDFYNWAVDQGDIDKQREYHNKILDFIDAVKFFDGGLANELQATALQIA